MAHIAYTSSRMKITTPTRPWTAVRLSIPKAPRRPGRSQSAPTQRSDSRSPLDARRGARAEELAEPTWQPAPPGNSPLRSWLCLLSSQECGRAKAPAKDQQSSDCAWAISLHIVVYCGAATTVVHGTAMGQTCRAISPRRSSNSCPSCRTGAELRFRHRGAGWKNNFFSKPMAYTPSVSKYKMF